MATVVVPRRLLHYKFTLIDLKVCAHVLRCHDNAETREIAPSTFNTQQNTV